MADQTPRAPLIELRDIRKRFPGGDEDVEVLHGISLTIEAGECVAIMGSSGSGKSTLMHLLGCLDRASEGEYRFAGQDVNAMDHQELAWLVAAGLTPLQALQSGTVNVVGPISTNAVS